MLRVGDLIRPKQSYHHSKDCWCFFCQNNARDSVGIVTLVWTDEDDCQSSIAEFECGEQVFRSREYKNLEVLGSL